MKLKTRFTFVLAVCAGILSAANWNDPALTPVKITVNKNSKPLTVFAAGQSNCVIVTPGKEDKKFQPLTHVQSFPLKKSEYKNGVANFAALELQSIIKSASGVELPVITADTAIPEGKTPIFVGMSSAAKKYGFDNSNTPAGGFKIEVKNNAAAILNAPYPEKPYVAWDGLFTAIYATYDFAERFLECRFYYPGPDGTIIPKTAELKLPELSYSDAPDISMRILFSWLTTKLPGYPQMDPLKMALRYRAGGHGKFSVAPPPHWADPVKKEGLKPAVDAKGKPIKTRPLMPCFGNPESVQAFMKSLNPREKFIKILPPDHPIKCQCSFCKPMYDMSVPYHGRASKVYNKFVQSVAQEMKKSCPDKTFYFTAYYNYTSPAPGLTLPDNTMVQLCLMYGQNAYHDPYINKTTRQWIRDWSKITGKEVFVYVYPNWPGEPGPFPRQYYHNLKNFFVENHGLIGGLFSDGPNYGGHQAIEGHFYAFTLPSTFCEFKLLWNHKYDVDAGVLDMCNRMYGNGSKHMHKIITACADLWESKATTGHKSMYHLGEYEAGGITKDVLYKQIIKPEFVKMLKNELEAAYNAVEKDSAEYRRIDLFGKTFKLFFKDYELFINPQAIPPKTAVAMELPYVADIAEKADMPEWDNVPKQYFVNAHLSHGPQPKINSAVQIAYDRAGVIYKFTFDEPDMQTVLTTPAANVWGGDCIEVFTEYVPGSIYHITVNMEKAMRDRFIGKSPAKRSNMPYRHIVKHEDHWVYMLYLPFSTLDATKKFDPKGTIRFNAVRTRYQKSGDRAITRWHTTFSRAHADSTAFGTISFEPLKPKTAEVKLLPYVADLAKKANMPEWESVPKQNFINAAKKGGRRPEVATTVQMAYDKRGIIYKFVLEEPAMATVQTAPRNNIWNGDHIEVNTEYVPGSNYSLVVNLDQVMRDRFIGKSPAKRRDMPYRYFEKHEKHWVYMLYLPFVTLDATQQFDPQKPVRFSARRVRKQQDGKVSVSAWNVTRGGSSDSGMLTFETAKK